MKIVTTAITSILLLGLIETAFAQQARFDEANELLQNQEYHQAIEFYSAIAEEGYSSGALWLNAGIAYSNLDSLGVAKYYFMKAEKYPETKDRAARAIDFVNERFPQRSAVLPPLPWDRFFKSLSDTYGATGIALIALVLFYLGAGCIAWAWFRIELKKPIRYTGYTLLGAALLVFATAYYLHYLDNRFSTGVMVDRQTTVYEQPSDDAPVVSRAFEGYTMRVDYQQSDGYDHWMYVRLENGMYGWIDREVIKIL